MKKWIKKVCYMVALTSFILPFTGCGDDVINMDAAANDEITFAAVSAADQTTVTVPADYFGTDLSGATFDVFVNDTQIGTDLDPSDSAFYDATTDTVDFAISSINDGDIVILKITDVDGVTDTFTATVSEDAATFAVSVTE